MQSVQTKESETSAVEANAIQTNAVQTGPSDIAQQKDPEKLFDLSKPHRFVITAVFILSVFVPNQGLISLISGAPIGCQSLPWQLGTLVFWFLASAGMISFIEHQVHQKLMHQRSIPMFKKTFEAHAIKHHLHYKTIYTDAPVPRGEDEEIRLTIAKAPVKTSPLILFMALFSFQGAVVFVGTVFLHHAIWNAIHLEMHKPENPYFASWPAYKLLARYHYLHHCHPQRNFNVVVPFADFFMGTHVVANAAEIKQMQDLNLY